MISYRFKRRAFIAGMSGGVGLKIMLRNMEAVAQGTTRSPGRLLVQHWPVGIVAGSNNSLFTATSGSTGGSQGLQPFTDAGLAADMTVIRGISSPNGQGGSHEGGMPALMTGMGCPGTRSGEVEPDDGYAGGPSFEQAMLAIAGTPLKVAGSALNYVNAGCDTRTDFGEVSTKCMSYGTGKQSVGALSGPGQENIPQHAGPEPAPPLQPGVPGLHRRGELQRRRAPFRPPRRPTRCSPTSRRAGASSTSRRPRSTSSVRWRPVRRG